MTAPQLEMAFPLDWPFARPRTLAPKPALFRDAGRALTMTTARQRLRRQVEAMTRSGQSWRVRDMQLSTNIRFTASGSRDQNVSRREPVDVGVAFYFTLDGAPHVLACDRWDTVYDNIAAIAAHIEALRGQERWGVADLKQAFAGHVALPAPDPWWRVLGFPHQPSDSITKSDLRDLIGERYRQRARAAHPDTGGSREAWDRLSAAYETAKKAVA